MPHLVRLLRAGLPPAILFLSGPAWGQASVPDAAMPSQLVPSTVLNCLNAAPIALPDGTTAALGTVAVPCGTAANPLFTSGGGGSSSNGSVASTGGTVPASATYFGFLLNGKLTGVSAPTPMPAADASNASLGAAGIAPVVVTVGNSSPYTVARTLQANCTTGGTITFTEAGTSVAWVVGVGTTEIPHATTAVTSLGSAVCPAIYAHY